MFFRLLRLAFARMDRQIQHVRFLYGAFCCLYPDHLDRRDRLVRVFVNLAFVLDLNCRARRRDFFDLYF